MKNKLIITILMILIVLICVNNVCADENICNDTVAASHDLNDEIENIPVDGDIEMSPSSEIIVTEDNYGEYFNVYTGKLKEDVDVNINTIKISNVSDKLFTIDRPLNIMPVSSDCKISNGVIHLVSGSSGSNITGLVINNTKGEIYREGLFISKLHGIWISNSSDNLIYNNTICIPGVEGCYAMPMGYSSRNRILYNDIVSTFTSTILMGSCHYNNISYNRIEMTSYRPMVTSNLIYINPYGHADYSGPADCIGTYISNNYFKGFCNGEWSIIVRIMGKSDDTTILNNTIFKGCSGISVDNLLIRNKPYNITISNNTIINSSSSIEVSANNVLISDNIIIGSSQDVGISVGYLKNQKSNITVRNNLINYRDLGTGLITDAQYSIVMDNIINISNFGNGILVRGEYSIIKNNKINVNADNGICIFTNYSSIENNFISTFGNGVSIISEMDPKGDIYKVYNNSIVENSIYSDKYAVYIKGFVYNTLVHDNLVETNQSEAFYIDVEETIEDKNSGNFTENTINGVIENTERLIIDDNNFYEYFNDEGYLKFSFKENSKKILFITFLTNKNIYLTDKITLTSNKLPNLLYNVSIILKGGAGESTISDFNFYNSDKSSIVIDGVDDVTIKDNDFTTLTDNIFDINTISAIGGCYNCNIFNNNIFMNSKANYTYAIYVSEPINSVMKSLSHNFTISNNNILIKTTGVGEGMYFDALVESDIIHNSINIVSTGSAYGISACNVFGNLYDLNINSNEIFVNSNEMSYLIEIYRCDDCKINNNYICGFSNGVYGIGIYGSNGISINKNEIEVCGLNLTDSIPADALGKGNSAIYISRQSQIKSISNNIFDCENTKIISNLNSDIYHLTNNCFVISNYNHDLYFDNNNLLLNNIIKENDTILFKNVTDSKIMNINIPVIISSYNHNNMFKSILILSENASTSKISNLSFVDANLILDNVNNILILNNSFISSNIHDTLGFKNNISYNIFLNSGVNIAKSSYDCFTFNNVSADSESINIINSNYTLISDNLFNCSNTAINSNNAVYNSILNNKFSINSSYAYYADDTHFDNIQGNYILINFKKPTAIYYTGNSSKNAVKYNNIHSYSSDGLDYAILVDSNRNMGNVISCNYLIASNGYKRGDNAVNARYDIVCNNTPVVIYVSVNGSEDGDGSLNNPYLTISKAVENSLSGAFIHILPGFYNESNIVIDKNITLTAENIEGNTYVNALNKQLFNIKSTGALTVNALKIFNGYSVEGGSLFNNLGTLIINNSLIYNSSSYYNNSNPTFKEVRNEVVSYDCSNLGIGGAILNRGVLIINSSTLFNNFAHKGGAIADFGKTVIKNSILFNNSATHGGAVFTDSNRELIIYDSTFMNNQALTTLDYCTIKRTETTSYGYRYVFDSLCGISPGHGGAIYAKNSMDIKNSLFVNNSARCGGAIAYYSDAVNKYSANGNSIDYYSLQDNPFDSDYNLKIENSIFRYNQAKDTMYGNLSLLKTVHYAPTYAQNCHGGAIFGSLNEFKLFNSLFEYNIAYDNGGALCVQSKNAAIEGTKFYNNTAGSFGGALDLFGNYKIFNTDISSNYAKKGGSMQYSSYSYYGHVLNDINIFNVTISKNKALERGGAMVVSGNMVITHSNIYGNTAPEGSTISGKFSLTTNANIDARSNWWGSTDGPDDSVWNQDNTRFRTWLSDKVNWGTTKVSTSTDDNKNNGNGGKGKSFNPTSTSTGAGVHTGSTLTVNIPSFSSGNGGGFNFNGKWPSGNNKGINGGIGDSNGVNSYHSSGNSKNNIRGDVVNPNSYSKSNSSDVNNLDSVGMTANAPDSSSSSQSSSTEGKNGDSSRAYEINNVKKEIIDDDYSLYNILFVLLWIFLVFGFYRKYKNDS